MKAPERVEDRFVTVRRERGGAARCRRCGAQHGGPSLDLLIWMLLHECSP